MQLSNEQIQVIIQSIDGLKNEISNVDMKLKALCEKLGILAKTIETSSLKIQ